MSNDAAHNSAGGSSNNCSGDDGFIGTICCGSDNSASDSPGACSNSRAGRRAALRGRASTEYTGYHAYEKHLFHSFSSVILRRTGWIP